MGRHLPPAAWGKGPLNAFSEMRLALGPKELIGVWQTKKRKEEDRSSMPGSLTCRYRNLEQRERSTLGGLQERLAYAEWHWNRTQQCSITWRDRGLQGCGMRLKESPVLKRVRGSHQHTCRKGLNNFPLGLVGVAEYEPINVQWYPCKQLCDTRWRTEWLLGGEA